MKERTMKCADGDPMAVTERSDYGTYVRRVAGF